MNRCFAILPALIFFFCNTAAQVNDAGLWASVSLEKKLNKRWEAGLSNEFRFNENITEIGTIYNELSLSHRFSKSLEISGAYRNIFKRQLDDNYSRRHRFLVNVTARKKMGRITPAARLRYQSQYSDINRSENWRQPSNTIRTRISAKYDTGKRYTPSLSAETFYDVSNPEGWLFSGYRLQGAFTYELSKKSAIEAGYVFDREVNVRNPETRYIISLGWTFKL